MSLTKFLALLSLKKKSSGTTFIEVLTAISILSIIGIAISTGFSSSIILIQKIPQVVDDTINVLILESTLQKQVARVRVPFWVYDYKPEEDRRTVSFTYCDGIPYKVITFDYSDDHIVITTSSNDEKNPIDPEEPAIKLGPFSDVEYEIVTDDDIGLTGLSIKAKSAKENVGELTVYVKFESEPFWKIK